jgi:drug/metabolite transporter (DMT)-like permease
MMTFSLSSLLFTDTLSFSDYSKSDFALIFGSSIGGTLGLSYSSLAYEYAAASKITIFYNTETVFCSILEAVFLSYHFQTTDILGGVLIIGSLVVSTLLTKSV